MSYNYSKGSTVQGDIKAADDTQRDTLIDFGEDQIDFQTSGTVRMQISNNGVFIPDLDASATGSSLFVSGGIQLSPGNQEGIRFANKGNNELNFISFQEGSEGGSYNARMGYNSEEYLFIAPGRAGDFFLNVAKSSGDGTYPFSIMDDGTAKFTKNLTSISDRAADLSSDIAFYVSGTTDGNNNALFEGNVVMSGGLNVHGDFNAKQRFINSAKFSSTDTSQRYVRWDAAGSNGTPGVNNKFVAPCDGELLSVTIRSTLAGSATNIAFHKASNGTNNLNTTATETIAVDVASNNTAYKVTFSGSTFSAGEILGISVDPSSQPNDVNITCVWLFDWNS